MDIPVQGKEIALRVAAYGFIAVFEQMACAVVMAVEILSIPGKEFAHDNGDAVFAALKEEVYVIVHKDPRIDGAFPFCKFFAQALQKSAFCPRHRRIYRSYRFPAP